MKNGMVIMSFKAQSKILLKQTKKGKSVRTFAGKLNNNDNKKFAGIVDHLRRNLLIKSIVLNGGWM